MSNKDAFIERIRAMSPEEQETAKQRLLSAIFGPMESEEEEELDVDRMTEAEVDAYLRAQGMDPDELVKKLDERLEKIGVQRFRVGSRAAYRSIPTIVGTVERREYLPGGALYIHVRGDNGSSYNNFASDWMPEPAQKESPNAL